MSINFPIMFLAAVVPLLVGFLWYNPKTFGTAWMKVAGMTEESMKGANMVLIFGLTYALSFLAAMSLNAIVIHQFHIYSILINEPGLNETGSEANTFVQGFMDKYGANFRTFGHGALHGGLAGFFLVMPVMGVNALFERKGFRYVAINAGFWIVCLALMGGIICAFA